MIRVVAAIIKKSNTYLLARRSAHKVHGGKWEFPGGKIDKGEIPEQALERELYEEFGVRTKTGRHLVTTHFDYKTFQIELMAYESIYLEGDFQLRDHDQIAWPQLHEIGNYDLSGADRVIWKAL
mgnify:FL=1